MKLNIERTQFKEDYDQWLIENPEVSETYYSFYNGTVLGTYPVMADSDKTARLISEEAILQMILEDIKGVKRAIDAHQRESREEFRRIQDKVDELEDSLREEMQTHAVDIGKLQTKMKFIAWVAGGVAGSATSILILVVKSFMG